MSRLFRLAVYPARILKQTPVPPGWIPLKNASKERTYLYPKEEAALMSFTALPLIWRVFFGFCAREGIRKENAVTIEWSALNFDVGSEATIINLDVTKNGRGGTWPIDPGTAEALRRWRTLCPSERLVFPAEALPHLSSETLRIYRRNAETAAEANLGWLHPVHEVIPELAALGGPERSGSGPRLVLVGGTDVDR